MLHYPTLYAPGITMPSKRTDWVTASEAADILDIDRTTFYKWLKAGTLSNVRTFEPQPSGRRLYRRDDLEKFYEQSGKTE